MQLSRALGSAKVVLKNSRQILKKYNVEIGATIYQNGIDNFTLSDLYTDASDTKWVRGNQQHLYVGAMQGSAVKISICEYQSACMRDVSINGALGRPIK